jgi:hypothetical protein
MGKMDSSTSTANLEVDYIPSARSRRNLALRVTCSQPRRKYADKTPSSR